MLLAPRLKQSLKCGSAVYRGRPSCTCSSVLHQRGAAFLAATAQQCRSVRQAAHAGSGGSITVRNSGVATTALACPVPRPPRRVCAAAPGVAGEVAASKGNMSTSSGSGSAGGPMPVPLKAVVQAAVRRWFEDTLIEAQRGDVKQQALLAQMYAEGYGCQKDLQAAAAWAEKARLRGYKMKGVYCEL